MKINKIMDGPRDGEIRCQACFTRFRPEPGAERASCPQCDTQWRLSWPYPKTAKIRGPVWDSVPAPEDEKTFLEIWNS